MTSRGNPGLVGAGGIIMDDVAMIIISYQWHESVNVDEMMALRIGLHEASHISHVVVEGLFIFYQLRSWPMSLGVSGCVGGSARKHIY